MICERCGKKEAVDIFPDDYDGEGNPIDEKALCWDCFLDDIDEQYEQDEQWETDNP